MSVESLRTAYRTVAVIVVPAAVAYVFHVVEHPDDHPTRIEGLLRTALAVGAVVWVLLYCARAALEVLTAQARVRVLQQSTAQLPIIPIQREAIDPKVAEIGRRIVRRLHDN